MIRATRIDNLVLLGINRLDLVPDASILDELSGSFDLCGSTASIPADTSRVIRSPGSSGMVRSASQSRRSEGVDRYGTVCAGTADRNVLVNIQAQIARDRQRQSLAATTTYEFIVPPFYTSMK